MTTRFFYGSALLCVLGCAGADEAQDIVGTPEARINYSIGYQVGGDFRRQAVEINPDMLLRGISDAQGDGGVLMTPAEMNAALAGLQQRVGVDKAVPASKGETDVLDEGRRFLADNAHREGVTVLPSGLQYEVLSTGAGKRPGPSDWVSVNYRGTLIDGTEFDSSDRDGGPVRFRVDQVIPGWSEALQLMQEGAEWRLYVPTELAYPHSGPLEHKTLVFDVNLLQVGVAPPAGDAPH